MELLKIVEGILNRAMHKELCMEEIDKARRGFRETRGSEIFEYSMRDGKPQLIIKIFEWKPSPDCSGLDIMREGYYHDRDNIYLYTPEGKLLEKRVEYY